MIKYSYDAWGVPIQTITQGCEYLDVIHNPFKFKGYFYDEETSFYYLKSGYVEFGNSFAGSVTRLGVGGGSLGLARTCQEDWALKLLFDPVW